MSISDISLPRFLSPERSFTDRIHGITRPNCGQVDASAATLAAVAVAASVGAGIAYYFLSKCHGGPDDGTNRRSDSYLDRPQD